MTTRRLHQHACTIALGLAMVWAAPALAGETIKIGDDQSVTIGGGLRASIADDSNGGTAGGSSFDPSLDSARLYLSGRVTKAIGATFNLEYTDGTGTVRALDAYAQFEPSKHFNIWVGQMLPPSDRSNLDGPFYLSSYEYPGLVSQYPAKYAGRDTGATVWGHLANDRLVYAAGVFKGHNRFIGASNQGDNPLWAGRVTYNFWDVEDNPGYYTSSTYYGTANVLSLGVAGMYQRHGVGSFLNAGDYKAWNVDGLMERKIGNGGAVTLEFAYYQYRTSGKADVPTTYNGAGSLDNVGGLQAGNAYMVSLGLLLAQKVGMGRFQPVLRFQEFDPLYIPGHNRQYDAGLNYIIKGHNARVSLVYEHNDSVAAPGADRGILGFQVQY